MMELKKILVPFDGSSNAKRAFEKALSIAEKFDSTITVLTVLHKMPKNAALSQKKIAKMLAEDDEDISTKMVKDLQQKSETKGLKFIFDVAFDSSIPKGIVRYSNLHKPDLVVMGSYGRTGLRKLVLGSVAYGVVQNSKHTVMIVK